MTNTIHDKLRTIKAWYKTGTIPSNVGLYDEHVVNEIQRKSKDICKVHNKSVDFLTEVIDMGFMNATNFETPEEMGADQYDFQQHVASQSNYFEYYKLSKIVEEYGGNNSMSGHLPKKEQVNLLNKYHKVYLPIMEVLYRNPSGSDGRPDWEGAGQPGLLERWRSLGSSPQKGADRDGIPDEKLVLLQLALW